MNTLLDGIDFLESVPVIPSNTINTSSVSGLKSPQEAYLLRHFIDVLSPWVREMTGFNSYNMTKRPTTIVRLM